MAFADFYLQDITPEHLSTWRDSQQLAPASVRREMTLLMSVLDACVKEWGWLLVNPLRGVKKPPKGRPRKAVYNDDQIELICANLTGPVSSEVATLFKLSIETGMRSGEMVHLTRNQVDLESRVVHLEMTKNGDERDVPLSKKAVELLADQMALHARADLFSVSDTSRDTLFRRARNKAGVTGLTFHDARATAVTRLAKKLDIHELARMIGHRDLDSLLVYYRQPASETAKKL